MFLAILLPQFVAHFTQEPRIMTIFLCKCALCRGRESGREGGRSKAALVMTAYKFQMQMLSQARQWQVHQGSPHSHLSVLYAAHVAAPAHGNLCGSARLWLNFFRCVSFVSLPTSALHHLSVLLPLAGVRQSRLHYANNLSQLSCARCCKFHKFQFRLSR